MKNAGYGDIKIVNPNRGGSPCKPTPRGSVIETHAARAQAFTTDGVSPIYDAPVGQTIRK